MCEDLDSSVSSSSEDLDRVKIQDGQECLFVRPRRLRIRLVLARIRTRHYA